MESYIYKSAIELASLIREGEAKSLDIVEEHIDRIKKMNPDINALISLFEEEAINEARECDKEASRGSFRGPLHGVPVTIKEQFWIKGKPGNTNSTRLKDFVAPENAVIVDRILGAGAIILGQTNVSKNLTDYQVQGDIYPEGKNPYHTDFTPGGSTGGGAAALAAGFTPLELGGDFGGSIRVPAGFCGLYGLKPSEYTVPRHGMVPLPKNANTFLLHMVQPGPLARNIGDLGLMWNIIKGPHRSDRSTANIDWKNPAKRNLADYRIAWTDGWPGYQPGHQVSNGIKELINEYINKGGAAEKAIPEGNLHDDSISVYVSLFPYIVAQGNPWFVRQIIKSSFRKGLLKGFRKHKSELNKGFHMNTNHYGEVLLRKNQITERWERFFEDYDFLICPVSYGPAYKRCPIGTQLNLEGNEMPYVEYAWPYNACFNASGHPAISVPLGMSEDGLPIGVQIVGPYWSEPELFHFAKLISELTIGFVKPAGY